MGVTSIEWTSYVKPDGAVVPGYTFNPWSGCSKVPGHAGCAHCYAETNYSVRMRGVKWGAKGNRVRLSTAGWGEPLKWNRQAEKAGERRRVFTASLADVFEDWQGPILDHTGSVLMNATIETAGPNSKPLTMDDIRRDLFELIDQTPWLDWLILTKRPENVGRMWSPCPGAPDDIGGDGQTFSMHRSNVWLGTSVSDQATADKYVPELLKLRDLAPVLFLSVEPLLGPIEFSDVTRRSDAVQQLGRKALDGIDWIIVGGESGRKARPCDVAAVQSIVEQCKAAGVPVFVKQLGSVPFDSREAGRDSDDPHPGGAAADPDCRLNLDDSKGGDMEEWGVSLRVRQFPEIEVPHA